MKRNLRTTVTLESDVEAMVRRAMRERGLTFKQVINDAIRQGLASGAERQFLGTPTFRMGVPGRVMDHSLRLAAEHEDDEITRKLSDRS